MLVQRDNTIGYHVIILGWNGTIPDKTSCLPTGFIKSADYLFLTDRFVNETLDPSFGDFQVYRSPEGNI